MNLNEALSKAIFVKGTSKHITYRFSHSTRDGEPPLNSGLCCFWELNVISPNNILSKGMASPTLPINGLYGFAVKVLGSPTAKIVAPHQAIPIALSKGSPKNIGYKSRALSQNIQQLRGVYGPEMPKADREILTDGSPLVLGGIQLIMDRDCEPDSPTFRLETTSGEEPLMSFALACEFASWILRAPIIEELAPRYYVPHLVTRARSAWLNGVLAPGEPEHLPVVSEPTGLSARAWVDAAAEDILAEIGRVTPDSIDDADGTADGDEPGEAPERLVLWLLSRLTHYLQAIDVPQLNGISQAVAAVGKAFADLAAREGITPVPDAEVVDAIRSLSLLRATLARLNDVKSANEAEGTRLEAVRKEIAQNQAAATRELEALHQRLLANLASRENALASARAELDRGRQQLANEQEELLDQQIALEEREEAVKSAEGTLVTKKAQLMEELFAKLGPPSSPQPNGREVPKGYYYFSPALIQEIDVLAARGGRADIKTEALVGLLKRIWKQLHGKAES